MRLLQLGERLINGMAFERTARNKKYEHGEFDDEVEAFLEACATPSGEVFTPTYQPIIVLIQAAFGKNVRLVELT